MCISTCSHLRTLHCSSFHWGTLIYIGLPYSVSWMLFAASRRQGKLKWICGNFHKTYNVYGFCYITDNFQKFIRRWPVNLHVYFWSTPSHFHYPSPSPLSPPSLSLPTMQPTQCSWFCNLHNRKEHIYTHKLRSISFFVRTVMRWIFSKDGLFNRKILKTGF